MIRGYALWALRRLKGDAAQPVLRRAARSDPDAEVRREAKSLLDALAGFA
jgi:hypothetical protein